MDESDRKRVIQTMTDIAKPWIEAILQAFALAVALYFLLWPVVVDGPSMEATLVNGDRAIMSRILVTFNQFSNGDILVVKPISQKGDHLIKRLIASPGDNLIIENGKVFVNGAVLNESYLPLDIYTEGNLDITLNDEEYFVMGDNRQVSKDSRSFGIVTRKEITGKVLFRFWPFSRISGL